MQVEFKPKDEVRAASTTTTIGGIDLMSLMTLMLQFFLIMLVFQLMVKLFGTIGGALGGQSGGATV
ncbi:MAG: hypothetical protein ACP5I3_10285 [Thermoproteus sp.]